MCIRTYMYYMCNDCVITVTMRQLSTIPAELLTVCRPRYSKLVLHGLDGERSVDSDTYPTVRC